MAAIPSAAMVTISRATTAQTTMVAPFTGLKSASAFPVTRKLNNDITTLTSNGGKIQCMKVWPPLGLLKFETLSYLPPLSQSALAREVDYLLANGWVPCLEFSLDSSAVKTTGPQDTMTADTGQCGSCPCLVALTLPKC
ncbi:hypothetical protein AQUCO_02600295v1 [Aquilegia coerulea]|uniref:Ribulose bisphosphate carboxylase small subunit n=1 Tax=Aquilegia coerulea TaxID=218851 RepID=A0A2G5D8A5_AQUCA|nr:hypothetical protein AQUCO_02600295v1 [Aquilegia coerulea]